MRKITLFVAAILTLGLAMGCKSGKDAVRPVGGLLDTALGADQAPETVRMDKGNIVWETLLDDPQNGLCVRSARCVQDSLSTEGFGVRVTYGTRCTDFPDLRHGRMPEACFLKDKGELIFIGSSMEGTGVQVERPYRIRFDADSTARIVADIDPFDMQETFRKHLGYKVSGKEMALYCDGDLLIAVPIPDKQLSDSSVQIGEQICYDCSDGLQVQVTPGILTPDSPVPDYEYLPTVTADVTWTETGFSISAFRL